MLNIRYNIYDFDKYLDSKLIYEIKDVNFD